MSTDVTRTARSSGTEPGVSPDSRAATRVVLGSLGTGVAVALVLVMVVLPGASEGVDRPWLVGFGLGWAMLRVLSAGTTRPQTWAAVPPSR